MDQPSKWEYFLHLVEFAYNNGYHSSLNMSPFMAMYGIKCNTPITWDNPMDRVIVGPELLRDMEDQMVKIKQNLKVSQYRQKILCRLEHDRHTVSSWGSCVFESQTQEEFLKIGKSLQASCQILWTF